MKLRNSRILIGSGALLLVLAAAVFWLVGPFNSLHVTDIAPGETGQVGPYGPIHFTFDRDVQPETVSDAFGLEPSVEGSIRWEGRTAWFTPDHALPAGQTYTARLKAGVRSKDGRTLQQEVTWKFQVRSPWILYLAPASGRADLWRIRPEGGEPKQLTSTGGQIVDFAISKDGEKIIYSARNDQNGADLWQIDRDGQHPTKLIDCAPDRCRMAAWSPDGKAIAYTRMPGPGNPEMDFETGQIWVYDTRSGVGEALYVHETVHGMLPTWSPDGARLAFYDPDLHAIRVLDLKGGPETHLSAAEKTMGSWSSDGTVMVYNDVRQTGSGVFPLLYQVDLAHQSVAPFLDSQQGQYDYGLPSWSPEGGLIAIGKRPAGVNAYRQLWIMHPDGSQAHQVTVDEGLSNSWFRWDPWGQSIIFQQYQPGRSDAAPRIAIWSQASGKIRELVTDAAFPTWLP